MLDTISSYKDLTLLINTGEKVKALYIKSIKDIKDYFARIEGAKGYKTKTSYNDYDSIQSDRDTFESIGYSKLIEELGRLESMLYLQECNLKRYYDIKKVYDECANATMDITIRVSMLRKIGISQEVVSELVEKSTRTIKRYDKKAREEMGGSTVWMMVLHEKK